MDHHAVAGHLAALYEKGLWTDTIIRIYGRTLRVHRVRSFTPPSALRPPAALAARPLTPRARPTPHAQAVLSMSGYFNAVMSESWNGGGGGGGEEEGATGPAASPSGSGAIGGAVAGPQAGPTAAGATSGAILEFDIDTSEAVAGGCGGGGGAGDMTLAAFEAVIRFLYGHAPAIDHASVRALLVTASYFGEGRGQKAGQGRPPRAAGRRGGPVRA